MFCFWMGMIAGILLAYIAMHAAHQRQSWRSWLAGAIVLMVLIPIVLEFIKTKFVDGHNSIEAVKIVFFPWLAGVGFGGWIYLITIPLRRLLRKCRLGVLWMLGRVSLKAQAAPQQFAQDVLCKIANARRQTRDTEERLLDRKAANPTNKGLVKRRNTTAIASTEAWLSPAPEPDFNYALPCGPQLAAMLRNAADKLDATAREIELLSSTDDLKASFKRAMLATLQASNTVACFLSQNIEFADKKNSTRTVEEREDYVAKMVSARRVADLNVDGAPVDVTT
jgi:hypothetical protein